MVEKHTMQAQAATGGEGATEALQSTVKTASQRRGAGVSEPFETFASTCWNLVWRTMWLGPASGGSRRTAQVSGHHARHLRDCATIKTLRRQSQELERDECLRIYRTRYWNSVRCDESFPRRRPSSCSPLASCRPQAVSQDADSSFGAADDVLAR